MPEPLAYMMLGGRLLQEVTSIVLVNNTELVENVVVPVNKRRILLSIRIMNPDNVARAVTVTKYLEAAATNEIKRVMYIAAVGASGIAQWPFPPATTSEAREPNLPFELYAAGNLLRITWAAGGASAGATDADGLIIEWLEFDV